MLLDAHLQLGPAGKVVRYFEIIKEKWPAEEIPFAKIVKVGASYHELGEYERAYLIFRATVESSFGRETSVAGFLEGQGEFLRAVEVMGRLLREYPPEPYIAAAAYALAQQVYAKAPKAADDPKLREKKVNRIILTRPAVEAGEKLGFLPGDLQSKVDPYLRPLYDAMFDMMGADAYQRHQERGSIEVAPLAYMRGRTLDDSFIILDEAQNTSREQMKMFLTRIGFGSKVVITGDITQIDLPPEKQCGLKDAVRILADIDDIGVCMLTSKDVVRHVLVQKIINAYEKFEKKPEPSNPARPKTKYRKTK
jgi:hypothetical protein